MNENPKWPSWLIFVNRAPDDAPLLRLMVLNPVNDAVSTFTDVMIEADPADLAPQASDLYTASP